MNAAVVTAWHRQEEVDAFVKAWNVSSMPEWLVLQQDKHLDGCGVTKNRGVREAVRRGADVVVVVDGDCYPTDDAPTLDVLVEKHVRSLDAQPVRMYAQVTDPPSRGTPYFDVTATMPVAASMGFWLNVPDYCAVRQLSFAAKPMTFVRETVYGRYFPLCGMNLAFRPREWWPWCQFIEVSRFDDIWQGWLWQKEAYRRRACFNLAGPLVYHSRQSNVWKNLADEALYLRQTETLWRDIMAADTADYGTLLELLPTGTANLDRAPWPVLAAR